MRRPDDSNKGAAAAIIESSEAPTEKRRITWRVHRPEEDTPAKTCCDGFATGPSERKHCTWTSMRR